MIEVELKSYVSTFIDDFKNALLKHELYGIEEFDQLLVSMQNLENSIKVNDDIYINLIQSPIDKYAMGEYAIKYINNGYTHKQTAEILSLNAGVIITEKDVKNWRDSYSSLDRINTRARNTSNLFDIQDRMQDIYTQLYDHLEHIKETGQQEFLAARTTKQQVILETMKEIRMLTKDAANILESISHQQQLNEFRKVILESIKEVSPSVAQSIIRKLKQNKALFSALLPGD